MNPFAIKKIIQKNEKICVDTLRRECGIKISHRSLVMSDDFFYCTKCGTNRHYVKGISFYGWTHLPFSNKKYRDF